MSLASRSRDRRQRARDVKMRRYQRDQRGSMAARVPCGKVAYISKAAAKRYIKQYRGLVERAYRCPACGNWHRPANGRRSDDAPRTLAQALPAAPPGTAGFPIALLQARGAHGPDPGGVRPRGDGDAMSPLLMVVAAILVFDLGFVCGAWWNSDGRSTT